MDKKRREGEGDESRNSVSIKRNLSSFLVQMPPQEMWAKSEVTMQRILEVLIDRSKCIYTLADSRNSGLPKFFKLPSNSYSSL